LPPYIPPWRLTAAKATKDPDGVKYNIFTPFLPKKVLVEGELLGKVPQLCMEDWDFNNHNKYPQF